MTSFRESPYVANGQPELTILCYAERWNRHEHEAVGILDEAKARKLHDQGKLYTVVLGEGERPVVFIEVHLKLDAIGVNFLDLKLRDFLDYIFVITQTSEKKDLLFLRESSYREYADDDSDELATGTSYVFGTDGIVQVVKEDFATGEWESYKVKEDVSCYWEPVPDFGDYASIARFERP